MTVDTSNLTKSMRLFAQFGKTAPALMVNRTALNVIVAAKNATPFVKMGTIDSDLNVMTGAGLTRRGRVSKDRKRQHEEVIFMNRTPTLNDVSAQNTAQRIVLARMHPSSEYSRITGNRWPITMPEGGFSRGGGGRDSSSLFWKFVKNAAERMVKARHSSTHFLKASWIPIIMKLKAATPGTVGSLEVGAMTGKVLRTGEVVPAMPGTNLAVCKVYNTLGMENSNKTLGEKYNKAAHDILDPILQTAINNEYESKMQKAFSLGWVEQKRTMTQLGWI